MADQTIKPGLPTLHHLNHSQSQRIVWLLEELDIEYNLVLHLRDPKTHRAPPELQEIHRLGKAPLLVTVDGTVIAESSAIATYLLKIYDVEQRFATKDWLLEEQLVSFAGSSIGPVSTVSIVFDTLVQVSPWPVSYLIKSIKTQLDKAFTGPELANQLAYLESLLELELGKGPWFNGERLGKADFILIWPIDILVQRSYVDIIEFPKLAAWRERILASDAWKRGLTKGNGYDLTVW